MTSTSPPEPPHPRGPQEQPPDAPPRAEPSSAAGSTARQGDDCERAQLKAFLDKLRRQVLDERAAAWREVKSVWAKPIYERVADGYAIEGLEVVGGGRAGRVDLRCARNRSRFREGDVLCLNRHSPEDGPRYNVRLEEDSGTELAVTLYDGAAPASDLAKEPDGWVLDQGYIDLADHILEAIAELGDTTIGRERVLPILMGRRQPQTDTARFERGLEYGEAAGLNPEQSEALALGFSTDSVFLIQGPPGTGKTRVLAHLAALLVEEGSASCSRPSRTAR